MQLLDQIVVLILNAALDGLSLPPLGGSPVSAWLDQIPSDVAKAFVTQAIGAARRFDFAGTRHWLVQANNAVVPPTPQQTIGAK